MWIGPFPSWLVHGAIASHFGESVCGAGDVNHDGFDDVIVGAIYHTNGETEEGGAWLYLGSPAGADTTAAWRAEGDADNAIMGLDVSAAGDVNRDGFDDVIIRIPREWPVHRDLEPSTGPRRLRSGVYFLSLSGMGETVVRRLVIVR